MRSLTVIAAALVLSACSKTAAPGGSDTPPAPAENASATPAPQPSAFSRIGATLSDRLLKEAQSRPPIQPNADDLLAAFGKVGGAVTAKRQGLAATYKASFCEGGTTSDGAVTVGICEYADGDSAKAGLAAMQAIYPAKQASHLLHKDTVLTTLRLHDGPEALALESKVVATYLAL
jgi:hypothetical protein